MFKNILVALLFGLFFGAANAHDNSGVMLSSDVMITSQSGPVPSSAASASGSSTSWREMSIMEFGGVPRKRICPEDPLMMSVKLDIIRYQLKETGMDSTEIDRLVVPVQDVLNDKRGLEGVSLDAFRQALKPIEDRMTYLEEYMQSFRKAFEIKAVSGSASSRCKSTEYKQ